jgi:hypothetical protein
MFKMNFRVAIRHDELAANTLKTMATNHNIKITDLREADVIQKSDDKTMGNLYIVCCEGSIFSYSSFKKKYKFDEILYEGVKTLM